MEPSITRAPVEEHVDRFERALTVLARIVADLNASAKRCDNAQELRIAIERRTEADAVWCSLIDVIEVGGTGRDAAVEKARELVAEAVNRRG